MLYPLRFLPVYKDYPWGGRSLESLRGPIPTPGILAESWEVSCHPNGPSVVLDGSLAGIPLPDLVARFGEALLGRRVVADNGTDFPLLAKFIDARESLSIQVHPDDAYAQVHEGWSHGKNEMWYVVAAAPGSKLVVGLKPGTTRARFAEAIAEGRSETLLRFAPVFPGDVVDIPAGRLHGIGPGLLIYEVQQNCDLTYRVYDYGRRDAMGNPRPLHVEQALDVIDFDDPSDAILRRMAPIPVSAASTTGAVGFRPLLSNAYFQVEEWTLAQGAAATFMAEGERFRILSAVEGTGQVRYVQEDGAPGFVEFRQSESLLIPATLGRYDVEGPVRFLQSLPGGVS
jgi:mannose-6-phosphate isomerase